MNIEIKNKNALFPIGTIAKMYNISVAAIRLYEQEGLVIPKKSKGRHRTFTANDIQRIGCIRDLLENSGLNFAGIRQMLAAVPCWEIKPCSLEDRENCDAFHKSVVPCWMAAEKGELCKDADCSECPVYSEMADCSNIKMVLKKYWRTDSNDEQTQEA